MRWRNGPQTCLIICLTIPASIANAQTAAPTIEALNPLASLEQTQLAPFRERPMFSPSRRLAAKVIEADPNVSSPSIAVEPVFRLIGVLQTPVENVAQISSDADGNRFSVRVGDFLGQWRVKEITPRGATLLSESGELNLHLE